MLALAMGKVAAVWVVIFLSCCGIGILLRATLGLRVECRNDIFRSAWTGWCVSLIFLQIWNFFFPVNENALHILAAVSVAGYLSSIKSSIIYLFDIILGRPFRIVFSVIIISWWANLSLDEPRDYASQVYGLQAVHWAREYKAVPGQGNLNRRIGGFSNTYFLPVALIDVAVGKFKSHHFASGFFLFLLFLHLLFGGEKPENRGDGSDCMRYLFIPPLVAITWFSLISSPVVYIPFFALSVVFMLEYWRMVYMDEKSVDYTRKDALITSSLLAGALFCIYPASVFITVPAMLIVFMLYLRSFGAGRTRRFPYVAALILMLLLVVPCMVHSAIQSGYLVYPLKATAVDVDWRLSEKYADSDLTEMRLRAIRPQTYRYKVREDPEWRRTWFYTMLYNRDGAAHIFFPLALGIVFLVAAVLIRRFLGAGLKGAKLIWPLVPPLIAMVVWFWASPNYRTGTAIFWWFAVAATGMAIKETWFAGKKTSAALCFFSSLGIMSLPVIYNLWSAGIPACTSGSLKGFHSTPKAVLRTYKTVYGLKLKVPLRRSRSLWYAPLLSMPYRHPGIKYRGKDGDIAAGFVVDETVALPKE